jgi:hypothetical protein
MGAHYAQICESVAIEKHVRPGCKLGKEVRRQQCISNTKG